MAKDYAKIETEKYSKIVELDERINPMGFAQGDLVCQKEKDGIFVILRLHKKANGPGKLSTAYAYIDMVYNLDYRKMRQPAYPRDIEVSSLMFPMQKIAEMELQIRRRNDAIAFIKKECLEYKGNKK